MNHPATPAISAIAATPADQAVAEAFDALSAGDLERARAPLSLGQAQHPTDSRFPLMAGVLAQTEGRPHDAFGHYWCALAAEPQAALVRNELLRLVVGEHPGAARPDKDFSLQSGERQTADQVHLIRADHRARYAFAAQWLRQHLPPAHQRTGLDVFCGNGYGSRMVADLAGARMVGLDGSGEAIALAESAYGSHRAVFGQAIFPFEIGATLFDFAISFESIEHVDDPEGLLAQMARATDGPFILSVPNEGGLPFAQFGQRFEHHVRHFTQEEIVTLLARVGRPVIRAAWGQQVYQVRNGEMVGLLPPDRMGLRPLQANSQFCILVADRAA